jgi:pilus assembly protein TadC
MIKKDKEDKKRKKPASAEAAKRSKKVLMIAFLLALAIASITLIIFRNILSTVIVFISVLVLTMVYNRVKKILDKGARVKKIESVFPDFLQMMSSNLRAGMTIDRAMLLSSRPEFAPLDKEILQVGRDITTGKSLEIALTEMSKRIKSDKIDKTVALINSGIRAGGDLAILLDQTSSRMREREILEKKAASNVLMYVIFIFLAVSVFAPALFSLSTVLVEILGDIFSGMPETHTAIDAPFSISKITVSLNFIIYFSLIFIVAIGVLASLVLGLVSKGEERQGLKYLIPILALSLTIFFIGRTVLASFLKGLF